MNYVCLAAGKGTRLYPANRYLQKCMYPVGTRPFVEYSVRNLVNSATVDVSRDVLTFVVGHFAEQVETYFGAEYQGIRVRYVRQHDLLGTGHAIQVARDLGMIGMEAIVWVGDLYVPGGLFAAVRKHRDRNVLTVAEKQHRENEHFRVDLEGDQVNRCWNGSGPNVDIGLWRLGPELISCITSGRADEYRALLNIQHAIDTGVSVGYVRSAEWIHLGDDTPTVQDNLLSVYHRVLHLEATGN